MSRKTLSWTLLILANALVWSVLSFHRPSEAAPPVGKLPFSNAVEQRGHMIRELQAIQALLRQQNALLRSIVDHQTHEQSQPQRSGSVR